MNLQELMEDRDRLALLCESKDKEIKTLRISSADREVMLCEAEDKLCKAHRQVAMLRSVLARTSKEFRAGVHTVEASDLRTEALVNTEATARKYEQEVKTEVQDCVRNYWLFT